MAEPTAQWFAGVACICFVAVIWTLATVLKQIVFSDLHYDEPLVLAYVCNGCYVLQLPAFLLGRWLGLIKAMPWRRHRAGRRAPSTPTALLPSGGEAGSSIFESLCAGLVIAPFWFASQWTYSAGVAGTSVTSSTVISTTSVVWTLLASWLFLGERLTPTKVLGIMACMAGNVATLWGNDGQSGQKEHFLGDMLCLIAAVLYAVYTTVLMVITDSETSMNLVFGTIGVAILVGGAPLVFLLRREAVASMSSEIFGLLIFNGLFDNVLSQYAWAKAVQWTSPTTATVGLSLTIPLSIVADVVRRRALTPWSFVAAALVVLGFVVVTLASAPQNGERAANGTAPADQVHDGTLATPLSPEAQRSPQHVHPKLDACSS